MQSTFDNIILKQDEENSQTAGGIYIPPRSRESKGVGYPYSGIVLSVGWDVKDYHEGDHIVFDDMSMPYVTEDEELGEVLVIKESDVVALLK